MRPSRHFMPGLLPAAVALAASLMLGTGGVRAAGHTVAISNFAYAPATITVGIGDSIAWTNDDAEQHTVTPDEGGSFKGSGLIAPGESYSATFAVAGTFAYHCEVHPFMSGTVIVRGGSTTPAPTASERPTARATPRQTTSARPTQTASTRPTQSPSSRPAPTAPPSTTSAPSPAPTPSLASSTPGQSTEVSSPTASAAATPAGSVAGSAGQPGPGGGESSLPVTGPAAPGSGGGDALPIAVGVIVVLGVLAGGTLLLRRSR